MNRNGIYMLYMAIISLIAFLNAYQPNTPRQLAGALPSHMGNPIVVESEAPAPRPDVSDNLREVQDRRGNRTMPGKIEAEDFDEMYGTDNMTQDCGDIGGTLNIGWLSGGDYIVFYDVDFTTAPKTFYVRVAAEPFSNPIIRLIFDNLDNPVAAEVNITLPTGEWQVYDTYSAEVTEEVTGIHTVYVLLDWQMNINWLGFDIPSGILEMNLSSNLRDKQVTRGNRTVPGKIEAEDFNEMYGRDIDKEACGDDGGTQNLGWLNSGDYIVFHDVDFTVAPKNFHVRAAGEFPANPVVSLIFDSLDNPISARVNITSPTGGWQTYKTFTASITEEVTGKHTVYVLLDEQMNINWVGFDIISDILTDVQRTSGNRTMPGILQAEDYNEMYGGDYPRQEECGDEGGGLNLRGLNAGDYVVFDDVDFTKAPKAFYVRVAGDDAASPTIRLIFDSLENPVAAEINVTLPGGTGWQNYDTYSADITEPVTGKHRVFIILDGNMNLNWVGFDESEPPVGQAVVSPVPTPTIASAEPTPTVATVATPGPTPTVATVATLGPTPTAVLANTQVNGQVPKDAGGVGGIGAWVVAGIELASLTVVGWVCHFVIKKRKGVY